MKKVKKFFTFYLFISIFYIIFVSEIKNIDYGKN